MRRPQAVLCLVLWLVYACVPPATLQTEHTAPQPVLGAAGAVSERKAAELIAGAAEARGVSQRQRLEAVVSALRASIAAPLVAGNKVTPLVDGPATFAAIENAITYARQSVHVETYIFSGDEFSQAFVDLLMRKRREGVEVRVIYDGVGSRSTPDSFFAQMRDAGIEVAEFRPLNPIRTLPWRHHNRDHRKMLIIDSRIAFTGGMNISNTYASSSSTRPGPDAGLTEAWRDTEVRIEGPAALEFQRHFLETWEQIKGGIESRGRYFPEVEAAGGDIVAAVVSSGTRQQDEAIYATYLTAIRHATERIWITQAYFAPPEEMLEALLEAKRRGVDVRIVVPGFSDSNLVLNASRAGYERMLRGGVRIFERADAFLHAKTAVIDRAACIIGSANLDYRSFLHNNEITAVIIGDAPTRAMEASFIADMYYSDELTLYEWEQRPVLQRFKETVSSWFKYWL